MDNKSIIEDIDEIQTNVVNKRNQYPKVISKYYEHNNKLDIMLLKKLKVKPEARFEIPKEFTLEENLVDSLNDDLINKEKINVLKDRLKNLDIITMQNIRMQNCDIYKQVTGKTL